MTQSGVPIAALARDSVDAGIWLLVVLILPLSGDGLIMGGSKPHPNELACLDARAEALSYDAQWRSAQHYLIARCTKQQ